MDRTLRLSDGRTLGYTEHGDLNGKPVFFIHGNPGSRLMRHPDESIAQSLGARIITPDRPGYGLSDFQPGRRLLDFPDDLAQLADHLNVSTFAVFGVSAGGPYTAAVAYKLPARVKIAAIVSGAAPFDRANPYEGVAPAYKMAYQMAAYPAWLLKPLMAMQTRAILKDVEKDWQQVLARVSEGDRRILSQPEVAAQVKHYRVEATRKGVDGMVHEAKVLVASWGFKPEEIRVPVHLWYWADDPAVPPAMGRYLESRIPGTVPHFLPGGGHFGIFEQWRAILEPLVGAL